jgi:ParB family transcriptional regulator, chromosome partitioning protein
MLAIKEGKPATNAAKTSDSASEFRHVPLAELIESPTNSRKAFDEGRLDELAASIRTHGVLSPLVARRVNGHFEIVAGARRKRAAERAGLAEVPVHIRTLTDEEAQELQIIENVQRADVHPFEEAQGYRALLERQGPEYTVQKIAARVGKTAAYVAKRLKLLDLIQPVADAFTAGYIGLEHALLIAKLTPDMQERALDHCFDGYGAGDESNRSLVPVTRLQEWITRNVYLSLKSVPFAKDDETLAPEAGSCTNCPKRTGFNNLLFDGASEDACVDASCFNRKLDAYVISRLAKMPNLVQLSAAFDSPENTVALPRRNYVEVVARRAKQGKTVRPEQRLCSHLVPAIYADGIDKGRLLKVCATTSCPVHFAHRQEEEKQRLRWKTERTAENRKTKQLLTFRHRLLAEVLKRVKPQLGCEELRLVTRFVLESLSHDLVCRLAKRRGIAKGKDAHDWQVVEKTRLLYRKLDAGALAILLFETILLGSVGNTHSAKDDLLGEAAAVTKVNLKVLRRAVAKEEKDKGRKKSKAPKPKSQAK